MSQIYKIPSNYHRKKKNYLPAYLKGYPHFFYINSEELFTDSDFDNWVLGLFNMQGQEIQLFSELQKDSFGINEFRVYSDFKISQSVNTGTYFFAIYNSIDDTVKFQSNCFKVISESDIEFFTFLRFKNSTNTFNFNYENISNENAVFLDMNKVESEPEFELTQYFEQTTGKVRNQKSQARKSITIETFFFDEDANDAMIMLSIHDQIFLNDKVVEVKEGFKIESNKFNPLEKGSIVFYDQDVSTINLKG